MITAFQHAQLFTGTSFVWDKTLLIEDGLITGIIDAAEVPSGAQVIDATGMTIAPAFIDIQIYGGNGKLFSNELNAAAIEATYQYCLAGGATQFCITLATNSMEVFYKGIDAVRGYWKAGGKGMPGLHLEGPYINPAKRGAHLEKYIKKPTVPEVEALLEYGRGVVRIMTLAPEQCDQAVIDLLQSKGILVSAGHSNASYRQGLNAFDKGIPAATHLFNAMSPLQHREPGLVGAIYNHPSVKSSVVPDGIHVDFAALEISKKIMGERLFVITDAVTATATGDYPHVFTGDRYTMPDGTLSGSALTMMKAVKNLVQHVGIAADEALRMASLYPAQLLNADQKWGRLENGYAAELVMFDADYATKAVYTGDAYTQY